MMTTMDTPEEKNQDKLLKRFFIFSLAVHALLILFLAIKSVIFPSQPKAYLPSLRVDLVGLPDRKVTDMPVLPAAPSAPEAGQADAKKEIAAASKAGTNETDDGDFSIKKKKKGKPTKKEIAAQTKLKNAVARIKALERVKALQNAVIKGNQISAGSALSGEARTSLETTYHDVILERIRSNWELPKWLQEQSLKAKVAIFIDRNGQLLRYEFRTPSGNEQFDAEVKRTLEISSPFPLPPEDLRGELAGDGVLFGFPL